MTCKANIPASLCDLSQETEALECRGCDKNKVGFMGFKPTAGGNHSDGSSHLPKAPIRPEVLRGKYLRKPRPKVPCSVDGCTHHAKVKGYCTPHYGQFKYGSLGKSRQGCSVEGCDKAHKSKGMCQKHYDQKKKAAMTARRRGSKVILVKNGRVAK